MSVYSDLILASSPVAYWRLDETSGTNANDSSPNNHDATYTGTFTLNQSSLIVQEPTAKSVSLNGTTGRVMMPESVPLAVHNNTVLTLECICELSSLSSAQVLVGVSLGGFPGQSFNLNSATEIAVGGRSSGADSYGGSTATIETVLGRTTHFVGVCDYTNKKVFAYVNGKQVINYDVATWGSNVFTYSASSSFGAIGSNVSGAASFYNGKISDVAVYKTLLTEAVVKSHTDAIFAQSKNRLATKKTTGYYSIRHLGI